MIIKIDEREVEVQPGEILLKAARRAGITIPTLCYHEAFGGQGHCRMCLVELRKNTEVRLVTSCTYPIANSDEGMEVRTQTPLLQGIRRNLVMLMYSQAPDSELMQKLRDEYQCSQGMLNLNHGERCILCRLCVKACEEMGTNAISAVLRGTSKRIGTPYDEPSPDCIGCAACARICPTGAIEVRETGDVRRIWHRDFELVRCRECGKIIGTKEELAFLQAKLGWETENQGLCDVCRRRQTSRRLKDFVRT